MGEKLLPCPFCGAEDKYLVQAFTQATETFAFWSVECSFCGVEVADDESQEKANAAWNTRAPADLRSALEAIANLPWASGRKTPADACGEMQAIARDALAMSKEQVA